MEGRALLYHEPDILTILVQSSFLLLLNLLSKILDNAVYCGLLGQVFLGMAWGAPAAQWLSLEAQKTFTQVGYLGLILLVLEGGLSTNLVALRANLGLSVIVALTGVIAPIGASFLLVNLAGSTLLQAFAAGCALCSTSLGTTLTILKTSGLSESRLGTVLTSAAMLDDVVGLVMVQIISSLGSSSRSSFEATTVIRPVFVSLAFMTLTPALCLTLQRISRFQVIGKATSLCHISEKVVPHKAQRLLIFISLLVGLVAAAAYAGTSTLLSAYLTGTIITWSDGRKPSTDQDQDQDKAETAKDSSKRSKDDSQNRPTPAGKNSETSRIQGKRREEPVSIDGEDSRTREDDKWEVIDVHSNMTRTQAENGQADSECKGAHNGHSPDVEPEWTGVRIYEAYFAPAVDRVLRPLFFASIGFSIPITQLFEPSVLWRGIVYAVLMAFAKLVCGLWLVRFAKTSRQEAGNSSMGSSKSVFSNTYRPQTLYPAALLGSAMVARGEIGFLISAVAQSTAVFSSASSQQDNYLIVTWAILLCTIAGPISVGLLSKRVKRLQKDERRSAAGKQDPLGIWAQL